MEIDYFAGCVDHNYRRLILLANFYITASVVSRTISAERKALPWPTVQLQLVCLPGSNSCQEVPSPGQGEVCSASSAIAYDLFNIIPESAS